MPRTKKNPGSSSPKSKALGYARVSTRRQARNEVSLEEQKKQITGRAEREDADLADILVDRGFTGRDENRRAFQELIRRATDPSEGIDKVIVYSLSRAFRNTASYLNYTKILRDAGVELISATQDIPEGPNGELFGTIIAAFDTHYSEMNALVVRDVMLANAENGHWNGSVPPFGYRTRVDVVVGSKQKKVLDIEPVEAEEVSRIFRLYLGNEDGLPPLGIKAIVKHLNTLGSKRRGKLWHVSGVEKILKSETYIGVHYYNRRDSRTGKMRDRGEWVEVPVPSIIDQETFDAVRATLHARAPSRTAPRVVNGPTLLTGIAECGHCGGGMMLRTGRSGRYRYLTCAKKTLTACGCGQSVRMDAIDECVLSALEEKVFRPDRVREIIKGMIDRSEAGVQKTKDEIKRLKAVMQEAKARIDRLYDAIERGIADYDDGAFSERMTTAKLQKSEAETRIRTLTARLDLAKIEISDEQIEHFTNEIRRRLRSEDPTFRRTWLHMFVDKVVITDDQVKITGPFEPIVDMAKSGNVPGNKVPKFAREWRAREDSNS